MLVDGCGFDSGCWKVKKGEEETRGDLMGSFQMDYFSSKVESEEGIKCQN
jgi:hypothetical protein